MQAAILRETFPGERRVALTPAGAAALAKAGLTVLVERGAGEAAGFPEQVYVDHGAQVALDRNAAFTADILLQVRTAGANPAQWRNDLPRFRAGQLLIGLADPLGDPRAIAELAATGVSLVALELIPRITRAQSMDVLSSMATLAGYRAALLAAVELPKIFPLLMTAAGTLTAAKALVLGAGVAGLQAIATARRLGAIVRGYDVRPACREQVESLGARFVDLELAASQAEDRGGYALLQGEEFYHEQRQRLAKVVAESDVVICTAAIPGQTSPLLVTAEAVAAMAPGSVIVDLAAERGGNCQLTRADERVVAHGVTILGPTNLPGELPLHASQLFSGNLVALLRHVVKDGQLRLSRDDEIIRGALATLGGEVTHERLKSLLAPPAASP